MDAPEPDPRPPSPPTPAAAPTSLPGSSVTGPALQIRVPRHFEWNRYALPVPALPPQLDGFRIAHLTDFHLRPFWSDVYDDLVATVRREAPDLILLTGDFVNNKRNHDREVPFARRLLSQLAAPHGCFGVLGNHDRYALPDKLAGTGLTLLDARRHLLNARGAHLELLGLPGVHRRDVTPQILGSFPPPTRNVPRLILSHYPDVLRRALPLNPDLYFAGHTHGGQICLPNGTPIIRHDALPRPLSKGVHRVGRTWLVVSRGLGFTTLPFRIFCPAEVIEVTLTRPSPEA